MIAATRGVSGRVLIPRVRPSRLATTEKHIISGTLGQGDKSHISDFAQKACLHPKPRRSRRIEAASQRDGCAEIETPRQPIIKIRRHGSRPRQMLNTRNHDAETRRDLDLLALAGPRMLGGFWVWVPKGQPQDAIRSL